MSTDNENDEAITLALRVAFYAGVGSNAEEMDVQVVVRLYSNHSPFPTLPSLPPSVHKPFLLVISTISKGQHLILLSLLHLSVPAIKRII